MRQHIERMVSMTKIGNALIEKGIQKVIEKPNDNSTSMHDFLDRLASIPNIASKEQFYVVQYLYKIKPVF